MIRIVLLLIAVLLFVLAAFGVRSGENPSLFYLALAFWAASFIPFEDIRGGPNPPA